MSFLIIILLIISLIVILYSSVNISVEGINTNKVYSEQKIIESNIEEIYEVKEIEKIEVKPTLEEELKRVEYINGLNKEEYLKTYISISESYGVNIMSIILRYMTLEEFEFICRIVEVETSGQPFESKVNVANVIINRMFSNEFPNTILEILLEDGQFSSLRKSKTIEYTTETSNAIKYAILFGDTTNGSLFFCNPNICDASSFEYNYDNANIIDESGHEFYKIKDGDIIMRTEISFSNMDDVIRYIKIASTFESDINIMYKHYIIDGKSTVGVSAIDFSNKVFIEIITNNESEAARFNEEISEFIVKE